MTPPFFSLLPRMFARSRKACSTLAAALLVVLAAGLAFRASAQTPDRITLVSGAPVALTNIVDAGQIPGSQRLSLTLTLVQSPEQIAALTQFLSDVVTPFSSSYHRFLTPTQFAAAYGASPAQLASATAWATAQGLTVDAISPSATRLTVSGPAFAVQSALAVTVHNVQLSGALYYANLTQPSLPSAVAPLFTAIDGLSNVPSAALTVQGSAATFASFAAAVDANTSSILTVDSSLAASTLAASQQSAYATLLRQASAQGITLLATRPSLAEAFPAALAEVTAVAAPGATSDATLPTFARPAWQFAPGLPSDNLRYAPDLSASSLAAFAHTLATIELQTGRQGNINRILYELGPTPNLYTQPDAAAPGTWEPASGLGLVDLAVLAKVFPRGTTAVEVDTKASTYSPTHGAGFTLTTTVYPADSGTPTGTITWTSPSSGFPSTTIALNAAGVAVSPTFQLPGGTYTITSAYSGDSTYTAGSTSTNLTVNPEPANFTITAPASATLGGTAVVTATVSAPSHIGIPSGTITTTFTGATTQTMYLNGSGYTSTDSFTFNVNQAGTVNVQASCSGDSSFTCYNNQTATLNVPQATPAVSLALSTTHPTAGASVTFTVGVLGVTGITPTGTVAILDNGAQIASLTLPATTVTAPLGSAATHSVTAQYNGDANYLAAASSATTATNGQAATTITVTTNPLTITYGQTTSLNINVAPTSGVQVNNTQPSGIISFTIGASGAVQQALSNGQVSIPLTGLAVGSYAINVSYSGDTNYAASTSATYTLNVTAYIATITPQLSGTTFSQGSTQTLTVQLASNNGAQLPQNAGFIATLNGASYTGTFAINPGGNNATGQVTIYAPIAGTYPLQVTCAANSDFTCNTPGPITVTSTATSVTNPPPPTGTGTSPTQTVLTSSSTTPAAGTPITLTATISGSASVVAVNPISGTVTFYDGTSVLATSAVTATSGVYTATASVTLTGTATHSLTAVYSGNTVFATSTSNTLSTTSTASGSAITLTATSTTGAAGQAITFTALVTGSTFSGVVPTGSVTFYLGGTTPSALATIALGYQGPGVSVATFTTTGLPAGAQMVYAVYSGDGNFAAVKSNTITTGLQNFSLAFSPSSLALTAGQSGTSIVNVAALGGFTGTVTLTCIPPSGIAIACAFSPSTVGASGTTSLIVTTTAARAIGSQSAGFTNASFTGTRSALLGLLTLGGLFCFVVPGRTRRRIPAILILLLGLALTANLGCGSSGVTRTVTGGTPLGTSVLTINSGSTAGSVSISHTYSFQVTVQ